MAKFGCNVNRIRITIQRDVYFMSGDMQKNTTKEIPGLKYLMKLLQNQKLEKELNDF